MVFFILLKECLIVFVVSLEEVWCIETVWTSSLTLAAVDTVVNLLHHSLTLFREMTCCRGTAKKEGHSCACVDLDTHWARHTVATATAEFSCQL